MTRGTCDSCSARGQVVPAARSETYKAALCLRCANDARKISQAFRNKKGEERSVFWGAVFVALITGLLMGYVCR